MKFGSCLLTRSEDFPASVQRQCPSWSGSSATVSLGPNGLSYEPVRGSKVVLQPLAQATQRVE